MIARAATAFGAILVLALFGAGTCHALSLRNSAAEVFLGDALPGSALADSKSATPLRVENTGRDPARVDFKVISPAPSMLKDGYDPWPYPDRAVLARARAELKPGQAAKAELSMNVPKDSALNGGQYELDVLETGTDPAGESLTLKSRVLLSVGRPLPPAEAPPGGFAERPGLTLSPPSAALDRVPLDRGGTDPGGGVLVKLVNAGDEDLTVTLSPAREWDDGARIAIGYEPAPNPRWLRIEPDVVKIRAGAIGRARIWAVVPRQKRYAGRRWAFVAAVDAVAGGRRTRRYFVLHVNFEEMEEDTRAR